MTDDIVGFRDGSPIRRHPHSTSTPTTQGERMTENPEEKRTRPFADFLTEHNNGHGHRKASVALQDVVQAVVETGKKGAVTVTVGVEPMKGAEDGTLMLTVNVAEKIPTEPVKAAVFYADDDGNLTRTDPNQLSFDSLREAPAPATPLELKDRTVGGDA